MGGRLLRQRLLRPSLDRAESEGRLDAAAELLQQTILRAELRKQLGGILDIERLLAKITMGVANPRDVGSEARRDAAAELLQQTILRAELRKQLGGILDIERLLAKITMGVANPRDVLALGRSLEKIPTLKAT